VIRDRLELGLTAKAHVRQAPQYKVHMIKPGFLQFEVFSFVAVGDDLQLSESDESDSDW
jgi:hypothetical protein